MTRSAAAADSPSLPLRPAIIFAEASEILHRRILGYERVVRELRDRIGGLRQSRREIVAWVGSHIVPHEAAVRARLRHMAVPEEEISDIVQEAYLSLAKLDSVAHIRSGRAYFFTTARMVLLQRIRHDRIVRIDSLTEMQALRLADETPGPEQQVSARMELERVRKIIEALPERCREIFELRRIQGVSQREISDRLGIPEHTVEAQAVRGLRLIRKALLGQEGDDGEGPDQERDSAGETERDRRQQS